MFPKNSIERISLHIAWKHLHVFEQKLRRIYVVILSVFLTKDSAILWLFGNRWEVNVAFVLIKVKSIGSSRQFKYLS